MKSRVIGRQGELAFRSWGGARRGAGRKPKGERALVPHDARPDHPARFPLLITTRLLPGLPSLRRAEELALILSALASTNACVAARAAGQAADRAAGRAGVRAARQLALRDATRAGVRGVTRDKAGPPFQVVHYSIQSNHLHLIIEAGDRSAVTAGMRGLLARIARALNRHWRRRGHVFADRFHERELRNPMQVRNALVYVLQNLRKHGIAMREPDPFSSGPEFDGWTGSRAQAKRGEQEPESRPARVDREAGSRAARIEQPRIRAESSVDEPQGSAELGRRGSSDSPARAGFRRAARTALPRPQTWLLGVGWQRHGLIDFRECPRPR